MAVTAWLLLDEEKTQAGPSWLGYLAGIVKV
jgi:hypothetical protein